MAEKKAPPAYRITFPRQWVNQDGQSVTAWDYAAGFFNHFPEKNMFKLELFNLPAVPNGEDGKSYVICCWRNDAEGQPRRPPPQQATQDFDDDIPF